MVRITILFLFVFCSNRLISQLNSQVEQFMSASVSHDYFSGTILIAKDGKILLTKAYGKANIEHNVSNDVNTVFLIGSLTKQFTSMAIMQLVEKGKLKVNDPISIHLDKCPKIWEPITIKQLLTHTSGIFNTSRLPDWDEKHSKMAYTPKELLNLIKDKPLQFIPGQKHKYSNTNYHILGLIIEKISGMSYCNYLNEFIFKPLQMKYTGQYNATTIIPNFAKGYYTKLNNFVHAPYMNIDLSFSSGALYSTVGDMLLWDQALYTDKLISEKHLEEIFTPFIDNYGYGWEIREKFGKKTIGHSGSINGFSSYLLRFPSEKITIIVLSNSDKASAGKIAHTLSSLVFEKPYKLPKLGVFALLSDKYDKKGIDSVINLCKELKLKTDHDYTIDEDVLGDFGYDLLDLKKIEDAIKLFNYIIQENPKSSYAHDYLAEAYLHNKNYEMALYYFKKALELDPSNEYAIKGINKVNDKIKE